MDEEATLQDYLSRFKREGLISTSEEENLIRRILKGRSWIKVFGIEDGDINDLDKAILEAIFCMYFCFLFPNLIFSLCSNYQS